MRMRKRQNLAPRMEACRSVWLEDAAYLRGNWRSLMPQARELRLEIGCGKGQFITAHAAREPNSNFIACEGQASVVLRALEKAEAQSMENLRIFIDYVHDLADYFEPGELAGIYLNFSDPWPKARHAKRRLTYHKNLANYRSVLEAGGFIEFKTDNEGLFAFTLEEIAAAGYPVIEMTRDLHGDAAALGTYAAASRTYMTEYEAKFSAQGKNINFVRI